MQYHDVLLPDFISVHLKGGPVFSTSVASTISGREIRFYERQNAIQKYSLVGCRLSKNEFEKFNSFFRARVGCAYAFRVRDHADFQIKEQFIIETDGVSQEFEVYKSYEDDLCGYKRKISALRNDTIEMNCEIDSIDNINGTIRTKGVLERGVKLVMTAEFDVWVRFTSDELCYSGNIDGSIMIENLNLIEVI